MKHLAIIIAMLFVSCAKDETEYYAAYTASCFSCTVEAFDDGGRVFRDTLTGSVADNGDTIPVNWKSNFMAFNGDPVHIRACSNLPDSIRFPVVVSVLNNWVNGKAIATSVSTQCAEVNSTFHQ